MIRAMIGFVLVSGVVFISAWFSQNPGDVLIHWQGWRIETSAPAALGAIFILVIFSAFIYRFWLWLRKGPRRIGKSREAERRRQGYKAFSRGMVAIAAGDQIESHKLARRAEALLDDPPLTLLLSAQAAQLNGDDLAAERYFRAMLGNSELEFLGLRGLLSGAMRTGESKGALEYARRAYHLKPSAEWIQKTLFELQLDNNEWKQAEALLQKVGRKTGTSKITIRRRRAILFLQQAHKFESLEKNAEAVRFAVRATTACPEFVPAAVTASRLLGVLGKNRRGKKIIEKTWRYSPHPELVSSLVLLFPDDSLVQRRERIQKLNSLNSGNHEGWIALARVSLDIGDYGSARSNLEIASGKNPEARICALWAELEDALNGPGLKSREWLLRAAQAPSSPAWNCFDCGKSTLKWTPNCISCEVFDSLEWAPATSTGASSIIELSQSNQIDIGVMEGPEKVGFTEENDKTQDQIISPPIPDVPVPEDNSSSNA